MEKSYLRKGYECKYPVQKMTASTSRLVPSLNQALLPSNLWTNGLSSIFWGHLNPIGLVLQLQTTFLAPNLTHWRAISSADRLAPIISKVASENSLASLKSWEWRTLPGNFSMEHLVLKSDRGNYYIVKHFFVKSSSSSVQVFNILIEDDIFDNCVEINQILDVVLPPSSL